MHRCIIGSPQLEKHLTQMQMVYTLQNEIDPFLGLWLVILYMIWMHAWYNNCKNNNNNNVI